MWKAIPALASLMALQVFGIAAWASSDEPGNTDGTGPAINYGDTALHVYVRNENMSAIEEWLSGDIHVARAVNAPDDWGMTPLHEAALTGNTEIMSLLLAKGADTNARDVYMDTPLHFVAFAPTNSAEAAWILVRNGADVNVQDVFGETPLHWAAFAGAVGAASVLLREDVGAKTDIADLYGQIALDEAMMEKEEEVAELLLRSARDSR